ncbi:MAG: permease, partial [Gorillibacterium sp.]|nr:permease [Gorillibacterium sp.]
FMATYTAFRSNPEIIVGRMVLSILVGFAIGLTVYAFFKKSQLRNSKETLYAQASAENRMEEQETGDSKLISIMEHAGSEFFEMGKYLLFGCVVAAAMQTMIPRADLVGIGQAPLGSHFFMMAFAFILSICSTSDAFVAKSFFNTFSTGSLLTFLVFGPMLDLKSLLMLFSAFRARFVLMLAALIVIFVFVGSTLYEHFIFLS